ncbi:hypothetical protein HanPI659440_Chr13g0506801 [Helianthus annuus]|nr:hypothetical protein HanPI659440_Chr13g0506801 [Helianthus annuus]
MNVVLYYECMHQKQKKKTVNTIRFQNLNLLKTSAIKSVRCAVNPRVAPCAGISSLC